MNGPSRPEYDLADGLRRGFATRLREERRRPLEQKVRGAFRDEYESDDTSFPQVRESVLAGLADLRWTAGDQLDVAGTLERGEPVDEENLPYLEVARTLARTLDGVIDRFDGWTAALEAGDGSASDVRDGVEWASWNAAAGRELGDDPQTAGYRETFLALFDGETRATLRNFQELVARSVIAEGVGLAVLDPRKVARAAVVELRHVAGVLRMLARETEADDEPSPEPEDLDAARAVQPLVGEIEALARRLSLVLRKASR